MPSAWAPHRLYQLTAIPRDKLGTGLLYVIFRRNIILKMTPTLRSDNCQNCQILAGF